MKKLNEM
ncbi:Protein of unknown function [Bacillus mycoides]|nr:Protein of unknown function [Bacillus mycoides]